MALKKSSSKQKEVTPVVSLENLDRKPKTRFHRPPSTRKQPGKRAA